MPTVWKKGKKRKQNKENPTKQLLNWSWQIYPLCYSHLQELLLKLTQATSGSSIEESISNCSCKYQCLYSLQTRCRCKDPKLPAQLGFVLWFVDPVLMEIHALLHWELLHNLKSLNPSCSPLYKANSFGRCLPHLHQELSSENLLGASENHRQTFFPGSAVDGPEKLGRWLADGLLVLPSKTERS